MNAKFLFAVNFFAGMFVQVFAGSDLESTGSWNDTFVLDCVHNCSEPVFYCVSGLSNRVVIGTFDQDSAWERVLDTFDESVLLLSEGLFVNKLGETKVGFGDAF